jgi:hypothetical protein
MSKEVTPLAAIGIISCVGAIIGGGIGAGIAMTNRRTCAGHGCSKKFRCTYCRKNQNDLISYGGGGAFMGAGLILLL